MGLQEQGSRATVSVPGLQRMGPWAMGEEAEPGTAVQRRLLTRHPPRPLTPRIHTWITAQDVAAEAECSGG